MGHTRIDRLARAARRGAGVDAAAQAAKTAEGRAGLGRHFDAPAVRSLDAADATAEEKVRGATIKAEGAAFRSRRNWYGLKFNCKLAEDGESVVGFEFLVGDPIPRDRWDDLGLPAVH
jgi:hypothetical protein